MMMQWLLADLHIHSTFVKEVVELHGGKVLVLSEPLKAVTSPFCCLGERSERERR
jgi:hypothetical protein